MLLTLFVQREQQLSGNTKIFSFFKSFKQLIESNFLQMTTVGGSEVRSLL